MWEKMREGIIICEMPVKIVLFSAEVIQLLKKYRQQNNNQNESGGILLGEIRGSHFLVTRISVPQKMDILRPYYFQRKDMRHISFYENAHKLNECITYLGEWHTHPESNPIPSAIDRVAWDKITNDLKSKVLFVIIGRKQLFIELHHDNTRFSVLV